MLCCSQVNPSVNQPPPPPPPPPFRNEDHIREEGNLADVDSNSNSSSASSTSGESSEGSDSSGETSDDSNTSSRGGGQVPMTLSEATKQLYAHKNSDDPSIKPSFLRSSRKGNGQNDSGSLTFQKNVFYTVHKFRIYPS